MQNSFVPLIDLPTRVTRNTASSIDHILLNAVVITTAQLHSTKPELRFCSGSNPARGVSEICAGEYIKDFKYLQYINWNNILNDNTNKSYEKKFGELNDVAFLEMKI